MNSICLPIRIVLALSLSLTIASGAVTPCRRVHTVVEHACRDACDTKLMYQLCMDMLGDKFPAQCINDAGEYAQVAAGLAFLAYRHDGDFAHSLQNNASLSGEERTAYHFCEDSYGAAENAMLPIYRRLPEDCVGLADGYKAVLSGLEPCRDRVAKLPSSPLLARVKVDLDKTQLVYFLSKLLGVK